MDDDKAELIRQLYTRAGMEMEDASLIALKLGGPRSALGKDDIAELENAARTITHLLGAASSLIDQKSS